ncbi:putative membrane protein, partial [Vibrio cholerae HC-17A1]
IETGQA